MCYVIPFTLPCCRRTYVSVTKMKDCPADWPKTKCPMELCFQIGSQPDDREEGTCWRCKAAEAGIPQEHREGLRPGIDSADVERFILTPEERRNQMEEDGNCWFCGHRRGCESCEPVRNEDVDDRLLGRNCPPPTEQTRPVNKRLKIEHGGGGRPKSAASSSKMKAKGRPQTRSVSKQMSRTSSYSQSPPPAERGRRAFSPSEPTSSVEKLQPKQEYAGYGDQSHFFSAESSGKHSAATPTAEKPHPDHGDQSHLLDPGLFEQPSSSTPRPANQTREEPMLIYPQLTNDHTSYTKPEEDQQQPFNPGEHDLYAASPPRTQHTYQTYGQSQNFHPQFDEIGQASSSLQHQWYGQSHGNDQMPSHGNHAPFMSHSYEQQQAFETALYNMNQASPAFPEHSYNQNYGHPEMSYPFHAGPTQQSYGIQYNNYSSQREAPDNAHLSNNMLDDYTSIPSAYENTNTKNKRKREEGEYEYPDLDGVTRS